MVPLDPQERRRCEDSNQTCAACSSPTPLDVVGHVRHNAGRLQSASDPEPTYVCEQVAGFPRLVFPGLPHTLSVRFQGNRS